MSQPGSITASWATAKKVVILYIFSNRTVDMWNNFRDEVVKAHSTGKLMSQNDKNEVRRCGPTTVKLLPPCALIG